MPKILIGADPEFFLSKGDEYVSAHDIVPGTKDKPYPLNKGAVQADGTAVEFNINPSDSPEEFAGNIETVLKQIREMIDPAFKFEFKPSIEFQQAYFRRIPIYAKKLGCDPDYSAYSGKQNKPPRPIGTMRTGAGHIHVGWGKGIDVGDPSHIWDCQQVVQNLDNTLGQCTYLWDKDQKRMEMYGKAGAFRPKPYGVEYRVPSNAWLNYPDLWPFVFKLTKAVVTKMFQGSAPVTLSTNLHITKKYLKDYYYQVEFPEGIAA